MRVIIGMDPHKSSATIEAVDERGRTLAVAVTVAVNRPQMDQGGQSVDCPPCSFMVRRQGLEPRTRGLRA
jgi:hypothetical protein